MKIALVGNPNSGKTTLFNALTGSNQYVGNWPGVTVEKKEGRLKGHKEVTIVDLPGIYSLSPYTLEEVVSRNFLVNERCDAILNIVDGTNIERNLYLTTQLLELGIPVVLAINMMDVVVANGDVIDTALLSRALACPVYEISALKSTGVQELTKAVMYEANQGAKTPVHVFEGAVEHALAHIEEACLHHMPQAQQRWYAIKVFERDKRVLEQLALDSIQLLHIEQDIHAAEEELDDDAESIIINQRYLWIANIMKGSYKKNKSGHLTTSDRIDRIVTNRFVALPLFLLLMFVMYQCSIEGIGGAGTTWVNDVLFGEIIPPAISNFLQSIQCADWLQGLIVDGIVAGVGAVLGFVPQMIVLFLFLAFLESCGYMARVAFIMDRIFRKFGLSGKSFIPMLIGMGCGVPAIMASRTIENDRDRKMTIMTTTFVPCSAKLPVIALISGAFFGQSAWVGWSSYVLGFAAIVCSGIILKKSKWFIGDPAPFVMELPAYHWPTLESVARSVSERAWSFIKKAGTLILLSTIVLWFMMTYGIEGGNFCSVEEVDHSLLARIGNILAPLFTPLGWNEFGQGWKITVAAIGGLIAKENVVATFGMLFHFAGELSEEGVEIWSSLSHGLSPIAAYGFLAFNLLCAPCFAAMGAIKKEMANIKWFWFAIGYQCLLAYVVSMVIYQVGTWLFIGAFTIGTLVAMIILVLFVYAMVRPKRTVNNGK